MSEGFYVYKLKEKLPPSPRLQPFLAIYPWFIAAAGVDFIEIWPKFPYPGLGFVFLSLVGVFPAALLPYIHKAKFGPHFLKHICTKQKIKYES